MFGWFRKKSPAPENSNKRSVEIYLDAVRSYGAIIMKYPLAILDVSMLPLPKQEMKTALMTAYVLSEDKVVREQIRSGFAHLSMFQEGVGERPIDPTLPPPPDPNDQQARIAHMELSSSILSTWLPWHKKSLAELDNLIQEFNEITGRPSKTQ